MSYMMNVYVACANYRSIMHGFVDHTPFFPVDMQSDIISVS